MYYNCLRCGQKKELRKGARPGNNHARYRDLEARLKDSKSSSYERSRAKDGFA